MSETVQDLLAKIDQLERKLELLDRLLPLISNTCGRHNCNCPGSNRIKQVVDAAGVVAVTQGGR